MEVEAKDREWERRAWDRIARWWRRLRKKKRVHDSKEGSRCEQGSKNILSTENSRNNVESAEAYTAHFTSESHDTEKVKSIFKKRLSGSTSFSGSSDASDRISSLLSIFCPEAEMTKEFPITLPSDNTWRLKNYFKLLNKQREGKIFFYSMPSQDSDVSSDWDQALLAQPELKRAKFSGSLSVSSEGSVPTSHGSDYTWNSLDIAKAGTILKADSCSGVTFHNEEERRRVFALLYDVFRYKHILSDALEETSFFQKHPEHCKSTSLVWLLFYDLHKRRFLPREHAETVVCADAFLKVGLTPIENDLWNSRVKLAASLARNRIKNNALRLNQLLPSHLRDERFISIEDSPMTGWINTFRLSKKGVCDKIEKFGLKLQSKHETVLTKNDFRFDHLCPKLVLCHPIQRADLAQSILVKSNTIILQDRAFCIGPAIISKILSEIPLRGTIAQSHVNSPRTTAYLANILADNDKLDKIIAFGAGDKLLEYQTYLHDLGVNNCEIYAQKFMEIHPDAAVLENVVAIFATPPNSCTGVTDPVDFICSRGGDMNMLNALTQSELDNESCVFLEEQQETLKYCMALPQVQIILYETHSMASGENSDMVTKMINAMNDYAKEKHEEDQRILQEQKEAEERMNKPIGIPGMSREREEKEKEKELQEALAATTPKEVEVPPCDLFELVPLPDLCSHGVDCLSEEGCYIARIQRKEIISLDAKYMIKIAEARGLFGNEPAQKKPSTMRAQKKKDEQTAQRINSGKIKTRKIKVEIERITAPTQSSMHKTRKDDFADCPRHHFHTMESANKVGLLSPRSGSDTLRRKSRTKQCQDESVTRLSRPNRRWSTSPGDYLHDVRPSFWRYATATSVEDLIRALREKGRSKRSFRMNDYLVFQRQKILKNQTKQILGHREEIPGLQIHFFGKKYLYPFRTPYINNRWASSKALVNVFDDSFEDLLLIFDNDGKFPTSEMQLIHTLREGGNKMWRTEKRSSISAAASSFELSGEEKRELHWQCPKNANENFERIGNNIQQEQNKIIKPLSDDNHKSVSKQPEKLKKPSKKGAYTMLQYIQQMTKMDEVNNIINPIKNQEGKDIVLHEKYLPGQQTTAENKEFIKLLQIKLERLQNNFPMAHWTKRKERLSAARLFTKKKTNEHYQSDIKSQISNGDRE